MSKAVPGDPGQWEKGAQPSVTSNDPHALRRGRQLSPPANRGSACPQGCPSHTQKRCCALSLKLVSLLLNVFMMIFNSGRCILSYHTNNLITIEETKTKSRDKIVPVLSSSVSFHSLLHQAPHNCVMHFLKSCFTILAILFSFTRVHDIFKGVKTSVC